LKLFGKVGAASGSQTILEALLPLRWLISAPAEPIGINGDRAWSLPASSLEAGAPNDRGKRTRSRGVRSNSTPHTSGMDPPPPSDGSPGRDGGGLGLGGRHPSRLSMNIHPHSPLQGESTCSSTGVSTDFSVQILPKSPRSGLFWSQDGSDGEDGRLLGSSSAECVPL
jgi:hypothetical protein